MKTFEILIQVFIGILVMAVIIAVGLAILAHFRVDVNEYCCKENNATYVFYECQCNVWASCENLTCGNYCSFPDGHLENADTVPCDIKLIESAEV